MKIIITGCSGFIGMHLCDSLLKDGWQVVGIDNMNDFYDRKLKLSRLSIIKRHKNFTFLNKDIKLFKNVKSIFESYKANTVVNLAGQAGVRYSLKNPKSYVNNNIIGFFNILENCKDYGIKNIVYASSSSVYGNNSKIPFETSDATESPISIYAVTKKTNELMAFTYSHLYNINTTGLRFFTVYGPWGRPDMAMFRFTKKILNNEPIDVFNNGNMKRDFTYIDDIISGIRASIDKRFKYKIFNLGNNKLEDLSYMISVIEKKLGKKARLNFLEIQPGDVPVTLADINSSEKFLNYNPKTSISEGIPKFIDWYRDYFQIT